jgi:hypothetical protein
VIFENFVYVVGTWQCWFYIFYCNYNVFNIALLLYLHTFKYGYTFYITIKNALHVTGTLLLERKKILHIQYQIQNHHYSSNQGSKMMHETQTCSQWYLHSFYKLLWKHMCSGSNFFYRSDIAHNAVQLIMKQTQSPSQKKNCVKRWLWFTMLLITYC